MREILFRGIDEGTKEWVYGYYFERPTEFGGEKRYYIFDDKTISKYNVFPETVGQYTGLTDKNGKKIFEGDVVFDTIDRENALIIFDFGVYYVNNDNMHIRLGVSMSMQVEVIGNIHDNPELLESEDTE